MNLGRGLVMGWALAAWALGSSAGCSKGTNDSGKPAGKNASTGSAPDATAGGSVSVDGSSTVFLVSEAIEELYREESQIKVTVGKSGTGAGFKKFLRDELDVAGASRPILQEEAKTAEQAKIAFIELPVCFDALSIVVHPSNDWASSITVEELKKLWEPAAEGKITRWNQVREGWPDEEIHLFGAGTDSGTWDYFTEAIVGKSKSCRGDFTASEDDNTLVQGVADDKHALGFIPFAYYEANKGRLTAVAVDWEKDDKPAMLPTVENVISGAYNPLSRPLFIYVNVKSAERPEVAEFVDFYLDHVKQVLADVSYIPLPDDVYAKVKDRFKMRTTGSIFSGHAAIGIPLSEVLK